ncbi:hypothetical protein NMG60_11005234 [Bertholletia excelsa]
MGVNAAFLVSRIRLLQNSQRKPGGLPNKALTKALLEYVRAGQLQKAVSLLFSSPVPFPFFLYARLFQLCASNQDIVQARKVESHLVSFSASPPISLLNRAIETYGKCGYVDDATELFEEMPRRDGGSWNATITAYARCGYAAKALDMFWRMNRLGVSPNEVTYASTLGSCAAVLDFLLSRQIHGLIVKRGFSGNVILESSLVDIYGKCGVMSDARRMFNEIQNPNAISWNVIIRRYLDLGREREALYMFSEMIRANAMPLCFTVSNVLIACSRISALDEGIQIHGFAIKTNIEGDEVVLSSLINMYVKCGDLDNACIIFDMPSSKNKFNWTAMVTGYAVNGRIREARELFFKMPEREVISWNAMLAGYVHSSLWEEALDFVSVMLTEKEAMEIDHVTLGLILNICSGLSDVEMGKQVHGFIYRHAFCANLLVGNSLLDMYGKCGHLRSAIVWFHQMSHCRDEITWNTLLTSYIHHRMYEKAMITLWDMKRETIPSKSTFGAVLAACADNFALELGRQIHSFMIRNGYDIDVVVRASLVELYSKCHHLEYAHRVFNEAASRDVILWNSMVMGCCYNKRGKDVLELFGLMEKEGVKADHITFKGVLLGCIYEGYVKLGAHYFDSMSTKYCILPQLEHYECMIELYGRYGFMDELEDLAKALPFEPTVQMLTTIFNASREHNHMKLGKWATNLLKEMNPSVPYQFNSGIKDRWG